MNSQVRDTPSNLCRDRTSDEFIFDKNANEVNDYALRWGFEEACMRAEIAFGKTVPGGIIWHDLRRTFATRLRANGVHESLIFPSSRVKQRARGNYGEQCKLL